MKNKSMYVFLFMMLGLFAGMASPIQTSINSELRNAIHSPFIASLISFLVGMLVLLFLTSFIEHRRLFLNNLQTAKTFVTKQSVVALDRRNTRRRLYYVQYFAFADCRSVSYCCFGFKRPNDHRPRHRSFWVVRNPQTPLERPAHSRNRPDDHRNYDHSAFLTPVIFASSAGWHSRINFILRNSL